VARRGKLFGVGVGPGDPELVTLKARRVIEAASVIAYPGAKHGRSVARAVAEPYLRSEQIELPLTFPVTTGESTHPGGYEAELAAFYDRCAEQLAEHLDAGRDVAIPASATRSSTGRTCTSTIGLPIATRPRWFPASLR